MKGEGIERRGTGETRKRDDEEEELIPATGTGDSGRDGKLMGGGRKGVIP